NGEICIGGAGVAVGYWNRPELTKEKFINTEYGRLYRTGDLAKINENGEYIFIGRCDNQIKINGIRIELEEITSLVKQLDFIFDAITIYHDSSLIVFYTSNVSDHLSIRNFLVTKLHRAVVPYKYHHLSSFKLTSNGKIDKKSLP